MRLAQSICLTLGGLLILAMPLRGIAGELDRMFRPIGFEELAPPANATPDSPSSTPSGSLDTDLDAPTLDALPDDSDDGFPGSPSDRAPYESPRSPYDPPINDQAESEGGATLLPTPAPTNERWEMPGERLYHPPAIQRERAWWNFAPDNLWGGQPTASPVCCEKPKIKYWNHPLLADPWCSCRHTEKVTVVLSVPTGCCSVEVPVCLPGCCNSAPEFSTKRDLLGRDVYSYCWPCGQEITIVQRHTGTLVVHTYQLD